MSPRIHCIRHAESVHNINLPINLSLLDPTLTTKGEQQCHVLQKKFPAKYDVGLIVCSPLRRAVYTALLGFDNIVKHGVHVVALPELQEISDVPCDSGSPLAVLEKEFEDLCVDLSLVPEGWENKTGRWRPSTEAIIARASKARSWLKARPESDIVVVTHGGILHYLTEGMSSKDWANAEFRSFTFKDNSHNSLKELPESFERRQVAKLSATSQTQLIQPSLETWNQEGLMGQKVQA